MPDNNNLVGMVPTWHQRGSTKMTKPQKKGARRATGKQVSLLHPPQINMVPQGTKTLRFQGTSSNREQITAQNLLDTVLFASTATVGFDVYQAFRIKYIEMWSVSLTGSASTMSLVYNESNGSIDSPGFVYSDTTIGVAEPSHLKAIPPKGSAAAMWQTSANINLFQVSAPNACVIDICFEYIMFSSGSVQAQNALVAAIAGSVYGRGLDGLAAATSTLPMVAGTYLAI